MPTVNILPSPIKLPEEPNPSYCKTLSGQWVKVVRSMIRGLSHGEVQLTVKDGEVVEVRKLEKIRFERRPPHR